MNIITIFASAMEKEPSHHIDIPVFLKSIENKTDEDVQISIKSVNFHTMIPTDSPIELSQRLEFISEHTISDRIIGNKYKTNIRSIGIRSRFGLIIFKRNNIKFCLESFINKFINKNTQSMLSIQFQGMERPISLNVVPPIDHAIFPLSYAMKKVDVSVILEGENLEESKINISALYEPKSLKAIALEKIKREGITLEQAKYLIPQDLHEELKNY